MNPLQHVEEFLVRAGLSGLGAADFTDVMHPPSSGHVAVQTAVAKLYAAVTADHPDWDPTAPADTWTGAASTEHTKAFITYLADVQTVLRDWAGPYAGNGTQLDELIFEPGQRGGFLPDLVDAMQADDPDWTPPTWRHR